MVELGHSTFKPPDAAGIQFKDILVLFRGSAHPVLQRFSLDLTAGKITAILGPSGCGKSTLLRLIAGLLPPTEGSVQFAFGSEVMRSLPAGGLAYVFQDAALLPWRSVLANTVLPLEILGHLSPDQRRYRASEQLQAVGLTVDQFRKTPDQLSGGMRMRVSIARALVTDPSVLLLDEPFAALDDILRSRLGDMIVELWQSRRRTVVLVTHNISEAILLAHEIIVMGYGSVADRIEIDLAREKNVDPRTTDQFTRIYTRVSAALRDAVRVVPSTLRAER